jgi:hypothetical protein
MSTAAPKEGGKHEAEDFSKELLLGSQAAFDLDDEVIRQAQVVEGLVQGSDITLGVALLVLMAFFGMQATTSLTYRLVRDMVYSFVSFVSSMTSKETMPHLGPEGPGLLWGQQALCIND